MADSPHDAELRAALGLHRGRRVLGAFLLGVVAIAVVFLSRSEPVEVTAAPVVAPPVAPVAVSAKPTRPTRARTQKPTPKREVPQVVAKPSPAPEPAPAPAVAPVAAVEPELRNAAPPPPPPPEPEPEPEVEVEPASAPQETPPEQPAAELQLSGNGEAIARAIAAAKRAAVRDCFERELKQQPKLTGTVVVELDLAPPNRLERVRVSDDLERPAFTRCVTATMQSVRFAGLDEELSVSVPYVLSPERR
ncbi:MAG: AgmX/PglI C-terminal domain-containing protein [Myxococcota bacterium]